VAYLLPKASTTEDRERLLRRLEMCAKAREESTKIMSIRFAERDAVKKDLKVERQMVIERHHASQKDREDRWSRRLGRSPFHIDLVAESQRIDEESRVRDLLEKRRLKAAMEKSREAHNKILMRAMAESDELEQLRMEKRLLLENEKQLKALRDVERSNARTAQILQARKERQLKREQEA
jgi:adenylosuccinate synthase